MARIETLDRKRIADLSDDDGHAFVDVWGPECQPCLALAPAYEEIAAKHGAEARFFKLEAPANRMACVDLKVSSLPTFLHLRDGKEVDRLTGSISHRTLVAWIEDALSPQQ